MTIWEEHIWRQNIRNTDLSLCEKCSQASICDTYFWLTAFGPAGISTAGCREFKARAVEGAGPYD